MSLVLVGTLMTVGCNKQDSPRASSEARKERPDQKDKGRYKGEDRAKPITPSPTPPAAEVTPAPPNQPNHITPTVPTPTAPRDVSTTAPPSSDVTPVEPESPSETPAQTGEAVPPTSGEASPNLEVPDLETAGELLTYVRASEAMEGRFVQLMSAGDPQATERATQELVDEVYSEAELVPAKLYEIQLLVKNWADERRYDEQSQQKVLLLQSEIEQRQETKQQNLLGRDGAIIVLSSAALGLVGGSPWLERALTGRGAATTRSGGAARNWIEALRRQGSQINGEAVQNAAVRARAGWSRRVEATRYALNDVGNRVKQLSAKTFAAADHKLERNLRDIGASDLLLEQLGKKIQKFKPTPQEIQLYQPTVMPGLRYFTTNRFRGQYHDNEAVFVFRQLSYERGLPRYTDYVTGPQTYEDSQELLRLLAHRPVREGGKSYLAFLDGLTGRIIPTRMSLNLPKWSELSEKSKQLLSRLDDGYHFRRAGGVFAGSATIMGLGYYLGYNAEKVSQGPFLEALIPTREYRDLMVEFSQSREEKQNQNK